MGIKQEFRVHLEERVKDAGLNFQQHLDEFKEKWLEEKSLSMCT
jgi:hypothetical protein